MGRGINRWHSETQSSEPTLYDTVMMDIRHYTLAKTHRMYTTKGDLMSTMVWVILVTFNCEGCTTVVRSGVREAGHMQEEEVCEKFLYLPLNFAVNLNCSEM